MLPQATRLSRMASQRVTRGRWDHVLPCWGDWPIGCRSWQGDLWASVRRSHSLGWRETPKLGNWGLGLTPLLNFKLLLEFASCDNWVIGCEQHAVRIACGLLRLRTCIKYILVTKQYKSRSGLDIYMGVNIFVSGYPTQ